MRLSLVLSAVAACLAFSSAEAGLFSKKKKEEPVPAGNQAMRRYVLNVPDKKTEKELVDALNKRQRVTAQIASLRQLLLEKEGQYRAAAQQIEQGYGVKENTRYYYDQPAKTLYELVRVSTSAVPDAPASATNAPGGLPPGWDKKFMRQFRDDESARQFAQMVQTKDTIVSQSRVFRSVIAEKERELGRTNDQLGKQFSLSRTGMYNYDPKTMILYEIIQPGGAKMPPTAKRRSDEAVPVGR